MHDHPCSCRCHICTSSLRRSALLLAARARMIMKKVRVEWEPFGVIGAIVPWNYPFHNVFNPVSAALFSGNAIVIKVSEYASWSTQYYKRVIDACLDAVGAPRDLVQFVVGYGETGAALVDADKQNHLCR